MRTRRLTVAVCLMVMLEARATADIWQLKTPSTAKTEGGSELKLPPGYFLDEEAWRERDEKMKSLEESSTRLTAENQSLRRSAQEVSFGWRALGVALLVGVAAGFAGAALK